VVRPACGEGAILGLSDAASAGSMRHRRIDAEDEVRGVDLTQHAEPAAGDRDVFGPNDGEND
jgi:hypothetical protein